MALTTGTASALVGGSSRKQPAPKMAWVEIVRGVFIDGSARTPGEIVELTEHDAVFIIGIGKAKKASPPPVLEEVIPEEPAPGEPKAEAPANKPKRMGRKVKPKGVSDGAT